MTKNCTILIVAILMIPAWAVGQNVTRDSYDKAREIVDKSLAAYGGLENLQAIQNFHIRVDGSDYHRNQSLSPGVPFTTARRAEMTMDLKNNRYRFFLQRSGVGSYVVTTVEVSNSKERTYADLKTRSKTISPARPNWREFLPAQLMPQFILLNGYGQLAGIRYLGRRSLDGRTQEVITYPGSGGAQLSLYIDAETFLISKHESLVSDSFAGDALVETTYVSYQPAGKFKVATEVINKTADVVTSRLRYSDAAFDRNLTDVDFNLDADLVTTPAQTQTPGPPVQKLGENVYTAGVPGYKVLFIDFKDHIWVLEAPQGERSARTIIGQIKETIPNKPIKYVVATHFHEDHSSGARSFIAEGATLITTKGNRTYFEQLVKSRFTLSPDSFAKNPQPLKMEFVDDGKRIFTDGTTTVELHDIGPSPHAEEMLVAYLPKEKIVFQADLGDKPAGNVWIASPAVEHFANWLRTKALAVEQIVSAHGTVMTPSDYEKAVTNKTGVK